jgi:Uma2 family endonuclease
MATHATYNDLLKAPEEFTAELLDGKLVLWSRLAGPHKRAIAALGMDIGSAYDRGREGPGDWWIMHGPEVHFDVDARVIVPDLAGWRRERMPMYPSDHKYRIAPDWVCEVLSPSTSRWDRTTKLPLYAEYGVAYAWFVEPVLQIVEVKKLVDRVWTDIGLYGGDAKFRAEPFEEVEIDLGSIWGSASPA